MTICLSPVSVRMHIVYLIWALSGEELCRLLQRETPLAMHSNSEVVMDLSTSELFSKLLGSESDSGPTSTVTQTESKGIGPSLDDDFDAQAQPAIKTKRHRKKRLRTSVTERGLFIKAAMKTKPVTFGGATKMWYDDQRKMCETNRKWQAAVLDTSSEPAPPTVTVTERCKSSEDMLFLGTERCKSSEALLQVPALAAEGEDWQLGASTPELQRVTRRRSACSLGVSTPELLPRKRRRSACTNGRRPKRTPPKFKKRQMKTQKNSNESPEKMIRHAETTPQQAQDEDDALDLADLAPTNLLIPSAAGKSEELRLPASLANASPDLDSDDGLSLDALLV